MTRKVFLNLAILCGILSQTINATSSEEGESSDIHLRKKRVIFRNPVHHSEVWIAEIPSIVHIKKNGRNHCSGSIMSKHVVITAANCVIQDNTAAYKVYSGSETVNEGHFHNVTTRMIYHGFALLSVYPGFVFNQLCQPIEIEEYPLPPNAHGTVYGWGCNIGPPVRFYPSLRAIDVPILKARDCAALYQGRFQVREDQHICTLDRSGLKFCGTGDYGSPLVNMNKLIGIYIYSENTPNHFNPDVYISLLFPHLREYIHGHVQRVESQY